jgi:hypothetical protein
VYQLDPGQYDAARALYSQNESYFPLIAAVINRSQDGVIFVDRQADPQCVYVEHAFGFAQVVGKPSAAFEASLQRYLLEHREFRCPKVRLYTPYCPSFLAGTDGDAWRSWRQHFRLGADYLIPSNWTSALADVRVVEVSQDASLITDIDSAFGLVHRFWRTTADFVRRANAVLVLVNSRPGALCYAAANEGEHAEIDIVTLPQFRQFGLARLAVSRFNQLCVEQNIVPLWDCFTNNHASMALCRTSGFVPLGEPYCFFTINR